MPVLERPVLSSQSRGISFAFYLRYVQALLSALCEFLSVANMKGFFMLSWALTFLVIALIAAVLGFGGIAGTAAGIAKVLFLVFLVLFIVSMLFGRRGPVV